MDTGPGRSHASYWLGEGGRNRRRVDLRESTYDQAVTFNGIGDVCAL